MNASADFREIAHSGGKLTLGLARDAAGERQCWVEWRHERAVRAVISAVYALPQGVAISTMQLGGAGQPIPPPPVPGCFQVIIGSDSEGRFGRECPSCGGYWRGVPTATYCPYCGIMAESYNFLTRAQRAYVSKYCDTFREALASGLDGEHVIDMDAVADAVDSMTEKPPFYYAEESQQTQFECDACGQFNDVLGKSAYCSVCRTWNGLQELDRRIVPTLRGRINNGNEFETCAKDSVDAFDSIAGGYVGQLLRSVPMTAARRARFQDKHLHNLLKVKSDVEGVFGIDLFRGIAQSDVEFATRIFHRRHVYTHRDGVADEKYLRDSGDSSVRKGEALRETKESANRSVTVVLRLIKNLHAGFHEMLKPDNAMINAHKGVSASDNG